MREPGRCIDERGGYRQYECFVDATFSDERVAEAESAARKSIKY